MLDEQAEQQADQAAADFREIFLHMRNRSQRATILWLADALASYGGEITLVAPTLGVIRRDYAEATYCTRSGH